MYVSTYLSAVAHKKRFAVFQNPSGNALAPLDAKAAQGFLLLARGDGVVEIWLDSSSMSSDQNSASTIRSICSRMVRRIVSRSKLEVSDRVS